MQNRPLGRTGIEVSLRRLRSDYGDLYQLLWPERGTNTFGRLGYRHVDDEDPEPVPLEETLAVLADLVAAGKLRAVGVANATSWGRHAGHGRADAGAGGAGGHRGDPPAPAAAVSDPLTRGARRR